MSGAIEREHDDEPDRLPQRVYRALDAVDNMPGPLRACVHEFGFEIVSVLTGCGIKDPQKIRNIVQTIWMGARQPHQRQGLRKEGSPVLDNLDWVLSQGPERMTAKQLVRLLAMNAMVIVPVEPSTVMVEASMRALDSEGLVSKPIKHKVRLRAAIAASTRRLWPHLLEPSAKR